MIILHLLAHAAAYIRITKIVATSRFLSVKIGSTENSETSQFPCVKIGSGKKRAIITHINLYYPIYYHIV